MELFELILVLWLVFLFIGFTRIDYLLILAAFMGIELAFQVFLKFGDVSIPLFIVVFDLVIFAYTVDRFFDHARSGAPV